MDIIRSARAPRESGPPTIPMYDDADRRPSGAFGNPGYDRTLSGPLGIPGAPSHDGPPPPLPPPRFVPVEGPQPDHNDFFDRQRRESYVESTSFFGGRSDSNYGSFGPQSWKSRVGQDDGQEYARRDSTATMTGRDEGYASLSSYASSGARDNCGTKFRMHDHYQFRSCDSYDNQQLKKLDAKRPLDSEAPLRGVSALSSSMRSLRQGSRPHIQLPQLSLPARPKPNTGFDSPRLSDAPYSAVSPRSTSFAQISRPNDYRSPPEPLSAIEFDRSPFSRKARQNSGIFPDAPTPSETYDAEMEFPLEETSRLHQMHLDEGRHSRMNSLGYDNQLPPSLKRRASSPPPEDPTIRHVSSQGDLLRRRENVSRSSVSRSSPVPRLSVNPPQLQHGSISSVSSGDRSGSFGCLSTATSMTSSLSFGRRSPVGVSPAGVSPTEAATSPFAAPNTLNRSPRTTITPRATPHQRAPSSTASIVSPRKLTDPAVRPGGIVGAKLQGFFMCDCCPKKPKKFESPEDLAAHEAEKQYECNVCGNRFKNKNEAERHQNSLHVRRHSWSCSALSTYDRAFHESTARPGEADTCGYCGEEFVRSGVSPAGHGRLATEQDWDERVRHLGDHHKFRECNSSKKFFRADHFRQHLKHSHAGTSGKWTNMLENACMLEEEPRLPPGR
ncbi:unnamed protein product [Discula destructiva]